MRKRSSYRPKGVRLDVMAWIKQGMQPMSSHPAAIDLKVKNHAAMDELVKGRGTRDHCDVVIAALNMTEALAILRIGDEFRADISAGQEALLSMCRRGLECGRFVFTGPELVAVNTAMEIHDAQLEACTISEMERAIKLVEHTVRAKKAHVIEVKPKKMRQMPMKFSFEEQP